MEKEFWKSMTFWGAFGWAIVIFLDGIGASYPNALIVAKGISTFLTAFGIRRALE